MIQTAIDADIAEQIRMLWDAQDINGATSDMVYHVLHKAIVSSILTPGHRLGEEQLARLFNVSRTPIREAILRLEAENLAERVPRRGLVVSRIGVTVPEIMSVYLVREMLDGLAAYLAAQQATPSDIFSLEAIHRQFLDAVDAGDLMRISEYHLQFHETVARISRNSLLTEFVRQTMLQIRRFGTTTLGDPSRARLAADTHGQLIVAIATHDAERARELAIADATASRQTRINALEQGLPLTRRVESPD